MDKEALKQYSNLKYEIHRLEKRIEKLHTGEICAKVQNNSEFRIPKSDYFMYFCRIYEHEVYITA